MTEDFSFYDFQHRWWCRLGRKFQRGSSLMVRKWELAQFLMCGVSGTFYNFNSSEYSIGTYYLLDTVICSNSFNLHINAMGVGITMVPLLCIKKQVWVTWSRFSVSSGIQIGTRQSWGQTPSYPAHPLSLDNTVPYYLVSESNKEKDHLLYRGTGKDRRMYKGKGTFGSKETKLMASVWQEIKSSAKNEEGGVQGRNRASTRSQTALRTQCNFRG